MKLKQITIKVKSIPREDGGGFTAFVKGAEDTYVGDGESPIEALESLVKIMKEFAARARGQDVQDTK